MELGVESAEEFQVVGPQSGVLLGVVLEIGKHAGHLFADKHAQLPDCVEQVADGFHIGVLLMDLRAPLLQFVYLQSELLYFFQEFLLQVFDAMIVACLLISFSDFPVDLCPLCHCW